MTIVILDGIKCKVAAPDLDKDGNTGGTEVLQARVKEVADVIQPTELGETLDKMMDDSIEPGTRMSKIDMKSRLHFLEINSILAMDTLVALKVLPTSCLAFTRQKKRLNVSLDGKGREEMVASVVGKREQDAKAGSLLDKAKSAVGFGGK